MLDVFSTAELESGARLSVSSTVVEISCVFPARSLGKACFRCIAHAGAGIPTRTAAQTVVGTCERQFSARTAGDTCSCVCNERPKSISPKIRRAGENHQTCTKLSQTKFFYVTTLYNMVASVCVMFGMSYSRITFWVTRPREISTIKNAITHDADDISTPAAVL